MTDLKFIGINVGIQNTQKQASPTTDALLLDRYRPSGGETGPFVIDPATPVINSDTILLVTDGSGNNRLVVGNDSIVVPPAVTLFTSGTGNIDLPNNGVSRFKIDGTSVGATVTAPNLDTLTNGSNADALHTHAGLAASKLIASGLTTAGLGNGDFGYISAANVLTKTDATALASSLCVGANEGTVGSMTIYGIVDNAKFTTAGGMPANGERVYLAPSTEEIGAAGKLTATAPSLVGQFVAQIGLVIDNSNYGAFKTCKVLLQVKQIIAL